MGTVALLSACSCFKLAEKTKEWRLLRFTVLRDEIFIRVSILWNVLRNRVICSEICIGVTEKIGFSSDYNPLNKRQTHGKLQQLKSVLLLSRNLHVKNFIIRVAPSTLLDAKKIAKLGIHFNNITQPPWEQANQWSWRQPFPNVRIKDVQT